MLPLDCNAVKGEAWVTDVMAVAAGVLAAGAAAAAVLISACIHKDDWCCSCNIAMLVAFVFLLKRTSFYLYISAAILNSRSIALWEL